MQVTVHSRERVMTALLTAQPGKREELQQTLRCLLEEVREEPGCLQALVAQCVHDNDLFIVYLAWKDASALAGHMAAESFKVLLGASSILSVPAQFRFIADETPHSSDVTNKVRDSGSAVSPG